LQQHQHQAGQQMHQTPTSLMQRLKRLEEHAIDLTKPNQVASGSRELAPAQGRGTLDQLMKRAKSHQRGKRKIATPQVAFMKAETSGSLDACVPWDQAQTRSPHLLQQLHQGLKEETRPAPLQDSETEDVMLLAPLSIPAIQVEQPLPDEMDTQHDSDSDVGCNVAACINDESQEAAPKRLRPLRSEPLDTLPSYIAAVELSNMAFALGTSFEAPWERELLESLPARSLLEQALLEQPLGAGPLENASTAACLQVAKLCSERHALWLPAIDRWERKLSETCHRTREAASRSTPEEVLQEAKRVGATFGRALQRVADGVPGGNPRDQGAMTLEEELHCFAEDVALGRCGLPAACASRTQGCSTLLSTDQVLDTARSLWNGFGGVRGYAHYLKDSAQLPGAGLALNGGAAWQRLVAEVEIAVRLAHLQPEAVTGLDHLIVQLEGAKALGGQSWDDVAQRLMHALAMAPLQRVSHYVVSRMAWALQQQKVAAMRWLETCGSRLADQLYTPPCVQEPSRAANELVTGAADKSSVAAVLPLFHCLNATIRTGCYSPHMLMRPQISVDSALHPLFDPGTTSPVQASAKQRVCQEMKQRTSAAQVVKPPNLQSALCHSFAELRLALASHVRALGNSALMLFGNRSFDEALAASDLDVDQSRALEARSKELEASSARIEYQATTARRCIAAVVAVASASGNLPERAPHCCVLEQ